jgi:hypothetical protein
MLRGIAQPGEDHERAREHRTGRADALCVGREQEDCASDRRYRALPRVSETFGKGAQTESISKNVESTNIWAFFQAKSIRRGSDAG